MTDELIPLVITGASGRIGKMLRRIWSAQPPSGIMLIWAGRGADMDIHWDILAGPAPIWPKGAVVLHLAGVTAGTADELAKNTAMVAPLLAACADHGARALLVASTSAVYPPGPDPLPETLATAPPNPYGASKVAAEDALLAAALPVHLLRFGNVAGAQSLLSTPLRHEPIRLDPVDGLTGGPLRSWIGPVTLATVLAELVRKAGDFPSVVNIAQAPPLPMAALLDALGRNWHYGPYNPKVVPSVVLDLARLQKICPLPPADPMKIAAEIQEAMS